MRQYRKGLIVYGVLNLVMLMAAWFFLSRMYWDGRKNMLIMLQKSQMERSVAINDLISEKMSFFMRDFLQQDAKIAAIEYLSGGSNIEGSGSNATIREILEKQCKEMKGSLVLDLLLVDSEGAVAVSARNSFGVDYLFEQNPAIRSYLDGEWPLTQNRVSGVEPLEKAIGGSSSAILAVQPLSAGTQNGKDGGKLAGLFVAVIDLNGLDDWLRSMRLARHAGMYVVYDAEGQVLFYRDRGFSGASLNDSFNLHKFPEFKNVFERSLKEPEGFAEAAYIDDKTGEKEVKKLVGFGGADGKGRTGWRVMTMAESQGSPVLQGLTGRFAAGVVAVTIFFCIQYWILVRETEKRHHALYDRKKLADASALSDILRGVNEELSSTKNRLEMKNFRNSQTLERVRAALDSMEKDLLSIKMEGLGTERSRQTLKELESKVSQLQKRLKKIKN